MAKDRGLGDALKAQILFYPCTSGDSSLFESHKLYGKGDCPLSSDATKLFVNAYIGKPAFEGKDPHFMPLHATDDQLQGLAPAFVLTAECDVLRDEGEVYQARLLAAGVHTSGMRVLGTIHGFLTSPIPETPQYRTSVQAASDFLRDQFETNN
jgi:acetyl esterase